MFSVINAILGMVLLISVAFIILRKVFIGIKGSDSGIINLALIILGLVGLICTLSVFLGVFKINDLNEILNTEKVMPAEKSALIKQEISEIKASNIISLIVGYISLVFDYIVYRIIDKKNKQEQLKEKKHWNWNKLN